MIDWPNALVGFVLGFLAAVPFWWLDRRHAKRQRRQEALAQWTAAAKQIELLTYKRDTTGQTLYEAHVSYPVDLWRSILGPEDFRALERLENAWNAVEQWARHVQDGTAPQSRLDAAITERSEAAKAFANLSRRRQSEAYQVVVTAEQRATLRRDYRQHPVQTWKRQRHSKRVARANPWPDGTPTGGK